MEKQKGNNPILDKYWKSANQLFNQAYHSSSEHQASIAISKIKIMKQLSNMFLTCYCREIQPSIDNIYSTQQQIQSQLQKQWKIGKLPISFVLGYSIFKQIASNQLFICLVTRIKQLLQVDEGSEQDSQMKTQFHLSDEDLSSDEDFPNFYEMDNKNPGKVESDTTYDKSNPNNSSFFLSESDLILDLPTEEEEIDNNLILNQSMEIREYLNKLSKATSELTYLCQHLKWAQPKVTEKRSSINEALFSCQIQINIRVKEKVFSLSGFCQAALSKKQARRIASLFILRKIYNRFKEIWHQSINLREQNEGIQQPLNANNEQIFRNANLDVLDVAFFKGEHKVEQDDILAQKINEYLDTVNSYKNQLNLLTGKFKEISPPNFQRQKQNQMGLWPIIASLYDGQTTITSNYKDISKKKAEQKCSRELLLNIYKANPKRWQKFIDYKKEKCL